MVTNKIPSTQPPPPFLPPDQELRQRYDAQQVEIQVTIFVIFTILTIVIVLGRLRSRGNGFMKLFSTNAFIITAYGITFIPGLMRGVSQSNHLYVFWIAFIAYLAAVTNEVSCYTLGDNEDRKKRLIVEYSVAWPLIGSTLYKNLADPEILVPIVLILWVVILKLRERSKALVYATSSTNGFARSSKIISDFANYKKEAAHPSNNDPSYKNFLVGVREAHKMVATQSNVIDFDPSNSKVITLDKVWESNDSFLGRTSQGKELQNTCFSFSMFWVLLAKIAGYDNVDTKIFKNGKLPQNSFALVERELEFLYDYLFTNYYVIYERGFWKKFRDVCVISLFLWLTIPLLIEYRPQDHTPIYVILWGMVLDTGFTRFVILAIITIEFTQIGIFLTSKWAKVMCTCAYLRNKTPWGNTGTTPSNFFQTLIKIACLVPRPKLSFFCLSPLTKRKIDQYSILTCYSAIPTPVWLKCWIGRYFELPRFGQAGNWSVDLSPPIEMEILKYVENCRGKHAGEFTNGVSSLEDNKVGDDIIHDYVKNVKSQAQIILVWHIATSYIIEEGVARKEISASLDIEMATVISNYCAYLVAFIPRMLPDHVYTTQCKFDEVVKKLEIIERIGEKHGEDPRGSLTGDNSIVGQARSLKEKLVEQTNINLWRTLAEFWTELLLFLALSDHGDAIDAHANNLCVGGQFITHLWALLTHAGCSRKEHVMP